MIFLLFGKLGKKAVVMDELLSSVLQSSFSIVVAAFLLLKIEKEIRSLNIAIERLKHCQTCRLSPFADIEEDKRRP